MLAIVVIVLSFIAALLGLVNSHVAKPGERSYKGLTRLGLTLVVLATLGMIFGVVKEISGIRAAAQLAQAERERSQMLKEIYAQVVGAKGATTDPKVVEQLAKLADRISAAASLSRESNFRMSDFSRSDFTAGNFTQASFRNALFREADLRGADLGTALIDEKTRLPQR
jgi:hypothetical protein